MPWSETPYSNYDLVGGEVEPEVLFEDKTVGSVGRNLKRETISFCDFS